MLKPVLKSALLAAALAVSLTGLSGCADKTPISPYPHAARPDDAQSLTIESAVVGDDSKITEPGVIVANSQVELDAVGGAAAKLTVDFEKQMVVVLTLGKQPSSGYWARISEVYSSPGVLWVQGVAARPGTSEKPEQKATQPYAAVVVEKAEGVIVSDITSTTGAPAPVATVPTAKPAPAKAPAPAPAPAPAAKPAPAKPAPAAAPKPESPAPAKPAAKEAAPSSTTPPAKVEEPMK